MFRKIGLALALLGLMAYLSPALAAKPVVQDIPEVDGVYDVAGHPGMKVRVFVHKVPVKPAAPGPSSTRQCGLTDPGSSSVVHPAGWKMAGDWTYRVNPVVPSTISGDLSAIVTNAFDAWMGINQLDAAVNVTRGPDTAATRAQRDGQNIIAWGRTSGSALGVTYIWYQGGLATELDTIMNTKFSWNWGGGGTACAWTNVYDAQNILTHELGHWFGLDDEYDSGLYGNNTMYGYGSRWEVKKNTPTVGDKDGIEAIY